MFRLVCRVTDDVSFADNGLGDKVAFYWEGNDPGDVETLTFSDLKRRVCQLANALKARGVGKGDRVAVYMPMILALPISLLACARIGAVHSGEIDVSSCIFFCRFDHRMSVL